MAKETPDNGLQRKLGLFPLTNIVVANMIGAGIFTTSGLLMQDLRNPGVMLALWIAGGLIAFCGALSYGEIGAAIPRAGGMGGGMAENPFPGGFAELPGLASPCRRVCEASATLLSLEA